jgi:hypothetical protein
MKLNKKLNVKKPINIELQDTKSLPTFKLCQRIFVINIQMDWSIRTNVITLKSMHLQILIIKDN